jgi:ribA/ribD-fused uncharacterized protein
MSSLIIPTFYVNGTHLPWSNFYLDPVIIDGIHYVALENFFQAMKTTDPEERNLIGSASTPRKAKQLGRKVTLRPDWDAIRIPVMRYGLAHKFTSSNALGQLLLDTGDKLMVEGNTWGDTFWGVDSATGQGENWLGTLLMAQRARLRYERMTLS